MGIATRLGPWLLGTVKETTGTTAGTIRNVGATPCQQFKTVNFNDSNTGTIAFAIPAGSIILSALLYNTTGWGGTTPQFRLLLNNSSIGTQQGAGLNSSPGIQAITFVGGATPVLSNIGTTDGVISYDWGSTPTPPTSGTGVLVIAYVVRNPDGTISPNY